jgi:hypothetical protein
MKRSATEQAQGSRDALGREDSERQVKEDDPMTTEFWRGRGVYMLLAGLLVALAPPAGGLTARAADPAPTVEPAANLPFVPSDATGFVTIRVADLFETLDLSGLAKKFPSVASLQDQFGIAFADVERMTIVWKKDPGPGMLYVFHTVKPLHRKHILKACAADAKPVKILDGKTCYTAESKAAIHFADDHVMIVGDTQETLEHCLKQAARPAKPEETFADACSEAGNHTLVAWSRAELPSDTLPVKIPASVESATATLDFVTQIDFHLDVRCANKTGMRWAVRALRTVGEALRSQMLTFLAMHDLKELFPSYEIPDVGNFPTKLFRRTERAIQHTPLQPEGDLLPIHVTIPMDAKEVHKEIESWLVVLEGKCGSGASCGHGECCESAPGSLVGGAIGAGAGAVVGNCADAGKGAAIGACAGAAIGAVVGSAPPPRRPVNEPDACYPYPAPCPPAMPVPAPACEAIPAPTPVPVLPAPAIQPVMGITPVPPPPPPATLRSPPASENAVKFTVVNVKKEPAMLFAMTEGGKLSFAQKVAPGEAVDLQTSAGQRWIAVFADKPAGDTFVSKADAVWLLR